MTNPDNAIGTNGAYSGRTSVDAFNDDLSAYSRGIMSGWSCVVSTGLTVALGGVNGVRDVAVATDNNGNNTTINNISASPVPMTISAAPATNSRIDLIVAYVDNPPEGVSTTADNPAACGIIVVKGTANASPVEPDDSEIRTAITADGASGTTAYYVILASITISAGTTDLDASNITAGSMAVFNNGLIQDGSITASKMDLPSFGDPVVTRFKFNTLQGSELGTLVGTTIKGTNITFGYGMYGGQMWIESGAGSIRHVRVIFSSRFPTGTTNDWGVGALSSAQIHTYYSGVLSGTYGSGGTGGVTPVGGIVSLCDTKGGSKQGTIAICDCTRYQPGGTLWSLQGTVQSWGSASAIQFNCECTGKSANAMPCIYQRGIGGKITAFEYVFEVYE